MVLRCVLFVLTVTSFVANANAIREVLVQQPEFDVTAARLEETNAGLVECWNAVGEIKWCGNEIVVYFVNGTTDIGPPCCQAIRMITHHCWPAMMTALGFTAHERDILRGYCDASSSSSTPAPSPSLQPPPPTANLTVMV